MSQSFPQDTTCATPSQQPGSVNPVMGHAAFYPHGAKPAPIPADARPESLGEILAGARKLENQIAALRASLKEAVEIIHVWHGFGPEWVIYLRASPEMKRITAPLTAEEITALEPEPKP